MHERAEGGTNCLTVVCISCPQKPEKFFLQPKTRTQTHRADMSDTISFEMGSVDRPNRFQVNPVNHQKNNNDTENRKSYAPSAPETDAAASASASAATDTNGPHKVYPRLTNSDGETMLEDDTFDATQLLKQQQQPRQQR